MNDTATLANDLLDIATDRAEQYVVDEARRIIHEIDVLNMAEQDLKKLEVDLESLLPTSHGTKYDVLTALLDMVSDKLDKLHYENLDDIALMS